MKYKLAAVIYDNDGNILGRGYNKRLKDRSGKPATVKFGIPTFSIHAEIACIMWAIKKFGINQITNQNIYIHRSNNKIAKPCDCCQSVIDMLKLHIYYSNEVN
jgi:tRNA(Arg) A34 adenosine deaminase TadA